MLDIERPFASAFPPLLVLVEGAATVAPANVVVPEIELRGAVVFGATVVLVVVTVVLVSASGVREGVVTVPVLLETEVSLD